MPFQATNMTVQTGSAYKLRRDSDLPFTIDNLRSRWQMMLGARFRF